MQATESGENLPTHTTGGITEPLPTSTDSSLFHRFIYRGGQKFQLGFSIPSYGKTCMNFFFFLIDKRWTYLQRNTLHRVRATQKARVALTEHLQECIKRDQRKLLEITLETHFQ